METVIFERKKYLVMKSKLLDDNRRYGFPECDLCTFNNDKDCGFDDVPECRATETGLPYNIYFKLKNTK